MKAALGPSFAIALMVIGCSPGLQQLQQAKTWAAAANYASIADEPERRRDVAADRLDADLQNRARAERAATASGPNARPAGAYYAADAELNTVLRGPAQGGCIEIGHAAQLLRDAGAEGTSFTAAAGTLNRAVATARRTRGCTT